MLSVTRRRARRNPQRIAANRSCRAFRSSHPFKQRLEPRVHLDGGNIPASTMSGKHPFEPVVEQLLERLPLLGPRPPAVLAECFEIIGFEVPGKRIPAEQTTLVVKIGDAAFGMPG